MMHGRKSEHSSPTRFRSVKGLYNFPNATDTFSTNCLMRGECSSFCAALFKHSGKEKCQREISRNRSEYLLPQTWGGPLGVTSGGSTGSRARKDISVTEAINVPHNRSPHTNNASRITGTHTLLKMISIHPSNHHFCQQTFSCNLSEWSLNRSLPRPLQGLLGLWNNSRSHSGTEYPAKASWSLHSTLSLYRYTPFICFQCAENSSQKSPIC